MPSATPLATPIAFARPCRDPACGPTTLRRLIAGLALAVPLLAAAQTIEIVDVGLGSVTDIAADGRAAAGTTNGRFIPFRWTAEGGIEKLGRGTYGPLRGKTSGEPAISADGQVVAATILDDGGTYATQGRWTRATGWQMLLPLPPDGGILDLEDSSVWGMSRDGQVVTGLYWRPGQINGSAHGSRWTAARGMRGFDTAGGSARIDDANADGSVMVGWEEDPSVGSRQAAVWRAGTRTFLDGGTGLPGEAASVSADGTIIVGQSYNEAEGRNEAAIWRWDGSTWQRQFLGVLAGTKPLGFSYATAVSDDGRVVVGFNRKQFQFFETDAFIWTPQTGMRDMMAFLAARGVDLSTRLKLNFLPAVNGAGTSIAAVGTEVAEPFRTRSVVIRLSGPPATP